MNEQLKLMAILAHPDDETLGLGGALAKYAAEGVQTYLVMATRGEQGWFGDPRADPGPIALGRIRERELHAAADVLGLHEVTLLDYHDGELDQAEPTEIIGRLASELRRVRPQVVVTFDPTGGYGHPDHIAVSQFTTAAIVAAASAEYQLKDAPHQTSKLYYLVETEENLAFYQKVFGDLVMQVDGLERCALGWPPWAITTCIDTAAYWRQTRRAVECHRTQLPESGALLELSDEERRRLWSVQSFCRAFSLVNGGREKERDLFAGLR